MEHIPDDGTVCSKGYGERSLQTADGRLQPDASEPQSPEPIPEPKADKPKRTPKRIKTVRKGLTDEKRREMSENAKAKWNALSPEEQQARKDKIKAGKKKASTSIT
jgi:hypothetical protein